MNKDDEPYEVGILCKNYTSEMVERQKKMDRKVIKTDEVGRKTTDQNVTEWCYKAIS